MASFYDSRSNDFNTALGDYLRNQNTIAQSQLEGAKQLAAGKEQIETAQTGVKAGGMEAAIKDKLQEHLNKFADEMGLDLSVQGLGKPLLTKSSQLLKAKATKMRESGKAREARPRDDSRDGTEMEDMGEQPPPTETDLPTVRETSFMDAEPRDVTGQARPAPEPETEAPDVRGSAPEPTPDTVEPEAPQVEAPEPTVPERPALRGGEFEKDPVTQAAIDRGEPIEVDAFSPTSAPIVRQQPQIPEPSEEDVEVPEQPGLAGPGEVPAVEPASGIGLPDAPPSISEGLSYVDESASTANPFSVFYRGDDPSAPGRLFQGDGPSVLRGPPQARELPDVDFQFRAPIDPAQLRARGPFTKKGIDRANAEASDTGGDALQPMRNEIMQRRAAANASEQAQSGERGANAGADDLAAENQSGGNLSNLQLEEPPYLRAGVPAEPPTAQPPGPDDLPKGGEMSDALQDTVNQNVDTVSSQVNDLSSQVESQVNDARTAVQGSIDDLTDQAGKMASDLGEKATSMLGDITGSDLLGGLGSILGLGADLLGPIMGGVGLFEAAKGIAEEQNDAATDPYAKVRTLIAQGQAKMDGLEANIASDQFAEKIGANAPKFGSLAAPVFSTQGVGGGSMHF